MISTFNIAQLNAILQDFYTLTHIRITVFDDAFHEITSYPKERAEICNLIRSTPMAQKACLRCDTEACQKASCMHSTYIYQCHAGLTEAISPIRMGNIAIGYLFFGHVFSYSSHEEGFKNISLHCKNYPFDSALLKKACYKCHIVPKEYISSASHLLNAVASYLCLERITYLKRENLPVQVDNYIMEHIAEHISADALCTQFEIGKTYLYKISSQSYGVGIAEHIRNLRIEKAKSLLLDLPKLKVNEVASYCGFDDYNYFISMFKKSVGMPPGKYRSTITRL